MKPDAPELETFLQVDDRADCFTCATCRFFDLIPALALPKDREEGLGMCRAHPPAARQLGEDAVWPLVVGDFDWCGEWVVSEEAD